jgi:hypothetical protein
MFLQGNLQFVWDIWAPILDPLATDDQWFGADSEGRPWANCFKESTLTSLNWIITHHFYLPAGADTASETMRQDIHQGDLDAKAMQSLGVNPASWPAIEKLKMWTQTGRMITCYGALQGSPPTL